MDLVEWMFFEKSKDKKFDRKAMAKRFGISLSYLNNIILMYKPPKAEMAYHIEKITNGKVSGWDLIKKCMEHKEKKEKDKNV